MQTETGSTQNEKAKTNPMQTIAGVLIIIAAILICIMGIIQFNKAQVIFDKFVEIADKMGDKEQLCNIINPATLKEMYSQSLSYFMMALGAIAIAGLLPRLLSFSIAPTGISANLQKIEAKIANIEDNQKRIMDEQARKRNN